MPVGPYDQFTLPDGAKAPLYVLRFDSSGRNTSPRTTDHLIEELRAGSFTEIYFFSHGWYNTFADALSLYKQYFGGYVALRAERGLGSESFRPVFIGTHWPSITMVLPWERGPKIAAAALQQEDDDEQMRKTIGLSLDAAHAADFYRLTERESLTNEEAQQLARILQPLYTSVADGSTVAPDIDEIVGAWRDLEASAVQPEPDYAALPQKIRPTTSGSPEAAVSFAEVLDPRNAVRVTTVLMMKDRAGVVGTLGVAHVLERILKCCERPIHLIGHSYGCRVMLTAVSVPQGLPHKVDSILLLQPAVNRYCFAVLIPDIGVKGGFEPALHRVNRPIFSTFSRNDAPLRYLFQFAARRMKDLGELRSAAGEPSIYAALGGYGPAGMIPAEHQTVPIKEVGDPYTRDEKVRVLALDGSGKITGHGDVRNSYTWWALMDQATH